MQVLTGVFTFPSISWWQQIASAGQVIFDTGENFEKMTGRNRYRIAGANNSILLSVPVQGGRHQHLAMKAAQIYNEVPWQLQHWRTLVSAYSRAPFFEHYEPELKQLFEREFSSLATFNKASIDWAKHQLRLEYSEEYTEEYVTEVSKGITDLRKHTSEQERDGLPQYYQVFQDRLGFLPDLSILDLLFSEGPNALQLLLAPH